MNKKLIAGIGAGAILSVSAFAIPIVAMAQSASGSDTFVSNLAAKLGIDQSKVQTAVDSVRSDLRAEHLVEVKTQVADAVKNGKITQRQADLLLAAIEVGPTLRDQADLPARGEMQNLTEAQRDAKRLENQTKMQQLVVDKLNEKGFKTSVDELKATRDAAQKAGIEIGPRGGEGRGMGKGMGRGGMGR